MEFQTNQALVRWIEDEGLSPFTLLKVTPKPTAKPKKAPASVVMEWGLEDLEYEGDREKFLAWRVTAEEIEVFRCEGELDRFEECNTELVEGKGKAKRIELRLEAGGTLLLRCARLVVSDKPVERFRKGQPRPYHGQFILEFDAVSFSWRKLRQLLGIPPEFSTVQHLKEVVLGDGAGPKDVKQVSINDSAGHHHVWLGVEGKRVTVSRSKWASDELWSAIWAKGRLVPGVSEISSRDLVAAPADWPEAPPRKPVPQVWPNVFGVECAFTDMTLDALRACLGLSSSNPFVFEDDDAPEPRPQLTLGEAARHGGGQETTGFFHDKAGKPIIKCRADLRESNLSFTRERACTDAAWLGVWRAPQKLPGFRECHSRTTQSPPDPWPSEPPAR